LGLPLTPGLRPTAFTHLGRADAELQATLGLPLEERPSIKIDARNQNARRKMRVVHYFFDNAADTAIMVPACLCQADKTQIGGVNPIRVPWGWCRKRRASAMIGVRRRPSAVALGKVPAASASQCRVGPAATVCKRCRARTAVKRFAGSFGRGLGRKAGESIARTAEPGLRRVRSPDPRWRISPRPARLTRRRGLGSPASTADPSSWPLGSRPVIDWPRVCPAT
jgi:hypothetical protein